MTPHDVSPIQQLNSDGRTWAAWLQLELELDPAPILQLAAASEFPKLATAPTPAAGDGFLGKPLAQRCPLCGAALVHVDVGEQCAKCGAVVDL